MQIDQKYFVIESKRLFPKMLEMRRHMHAHPELSYDEVETSAFVRARLAELGIPFENVSQTGIVATIGTGGPRVALRADLDALPIVEETGLEYASVNRGAMHACGHDMHTSMLLAAAEILKAIEIDLEGSVLLIFQPAEEKLPGGASIIVESGILDSPEPLAVFAQHINPLEKSGDILVPPTKAMAATDELYWTIRGKGCHAAQPHLGRDPIVTASETVLALQTLVSRKVNPLEPAVLSVTSFNSGNTTNVIPDMAELKGTLRTFNAELREEMHSSIKTISESVSRMHGLECDLRIVHGYPALINDKNVSSVVLGLAKEIFGGERASEAEAKMWAEDFSIYSSRYPACFWFLGAGHSEPQKNFALHNSRFNPDEAAMETGATMLSAAAFFYLQRKK